MLSMPVAKPTAIKTPKRQYVNKFSTFITSKAKADEPNEYISISALSHASIDNQSGLTYLFDKFKVVLNVGMQLLYCGMWYLLKVNVALQASQCLNWSRHSTRCG